MRQRIHYWIEQIWFPISLGLVLRLFQINSPILGIHSWRQADTAAMARHFAIENTPIWLPQIDWSGANPGYVECEFPLFPYLLGQLYKVWGIHEWIGRGLSIVFSGITIWLVIQLGKRLLDPFSGWWGGLFFAVLPLSVYYGRTLQAESMLLMFSALSLEQLLRWRQNQSYLALITSWIAFLIACLIKVLPFIWLGLPLLLIQAISPKLDSPISMQLILKNFQRIALSLGPWIYGGSAIIITGIWYSHAYEVGQSSGYSFGFWGTSSDRSSFILLFNLDLWLNLLLRISVRGLAVIGTPLVIYGILFSQKKIGVYILLTGVFGVVICTITALKASSIHEYYQLPLLLFLCPLMGRGWRALTTTHASKIILGSFTSKSFLTLLLVISLGILNFDYWAIERQQEAIWMPLAERIRQEVPSRHRIISVTGHDPTLLNLSRRQGWLTTPQKVTQAELKNWASQGASYLAGSLNWEETFAPLRQSDAKFKLRSLLCNQSNSTYCPRTKHQIYLVPLEQLIK